MEGESHSSLWSKLGSLFSGKSQEDHLEQAIREAQQEGELKAEESSMLLSILSLDELQLQTKALATIFAWQQVMQVVSVSRARRYLPISRQRRKDKC